MTAATSEAYSVFISYGRADARGFVERLAEDLEKTGGCRVCVDVRVIRPGESWELKLERAIREAGVVAAVLTPYSIRDESICRNEVLFAFLEHKTIVPIRISADPMVRPSLLLCRYHWIDFSVDYQAGLAALTAFLRGDPAGLKPPEATVVAGLAPIDFGPEIARLSREARERAWLTCRFNDWLGATNAGSLICVAEPGFGKSAWTAWLTLRRPECIAAVHFCSQHYSRTLVPEEFVTSVIAQLQAKLPLYSAALVKRYPHIARHARSAGDVFRELVVEPLREIASPSLPQVLLVDSLDEAWRPRGETIVDIVGQHTQDLPQWLRFLCTSRPEPCVLERVGHLRLWRLEPTEQDNLDDLHQYIANRLARFPSPNAAREPLGALAASLEARSNGNYLCARAMLDALEEGTLSVTDLKNLPQGLVPFYLHLLQQRFPTAEEYRQHAAPLLRMLVAARAPLPFTLLTWACSGSAETTQGCLRRLRSCLVESRQDGESAYALYHRSFADWLRDPEMSGVYFVSPRSGHELIAESSFQDFRRNPAGMSSYAKSYLPLHLVEAERYDQLEEMLHCKTLDLLSQWIRGERSEIGLHCLECLIGHRGLSGGSESTVAALATQLARIHTHHGRYDEAELWLNRAIRMTSWRKGRRARAVAAHELGSLHLYRSEYAAAERAYRWAARLCRWGWPVFQDELSANMVGLATVAQENFRFATAWTLAQRAVKSARRARNPAHLIAATRLIAFVQRSLGKYEEALATTHHACRLCEATALLPERPRLLLLLGWVQFDQAILLRTSLEPTRVTFAAAIAEAERQENYYCILDAKISLAWLALQRTDLAGGGSLLDEIEPVLLADRHFGIHAGIKVARATLAHLGGAPPRQCEKDFESAIRFCLTHRITTWASRACVGLGAVHWSHGAPGAAREAWARAIQLAGTISQAREELTQALIDRAQAGPENPMPIATGSTPGAGALDPQG